MSNRNQDKQAPVTREALMERFAREERAVAKLRSERTNSILDGKSFDAEMFRRAEDAVAATSAAIEEFDRRADEQAKADAAAEAALSAREKWHRTRTRIESVAKARMDGIEEMELAIRGAAEAYLKAERARAELQALLHSETGSIPINIMQPAQVSHLSRHTAAVLADAVGAGRFGEIPLRFGHASAKASWSGNQQHIQDEIERLLSSKDEDISSQDFSVN